MSSPEVHRSTAPTTLGFGVLHGSDTRTPEDDVSGRRVEELASDSGHRVLNRCIVRDEIAAIQSGLRELLELPDMDVVVLTGGTGYSPRDVTVEAVEPLLDRKIPGFGELFRWLSHDQVQAAAMLSRTMGGVIARSAVFVLPGSPKAVELAMKKLILPEVAHLLGQLRG